MNFLIRRDVDGVFRAHQGMTVPAYLGGVTAEACRDRVLEYYPDAVVEIEGSPAHNEEARTETAVG